MPLDDNINNYFDFSKLNKLDPKKGRVIISDPFVEDDYFTKSVVILCDHNDEGSFGFVLNNYIEQDLNEIIEDFPSFDCKVSIGGPVETNVLFFIHNKPNLVDDSVEIAPNLYMGGDFAQVKELIIKGELTCNDIKFFLGYSGWGEGQLAEELENNSWFVANLSAETIMNYSCDDMWTKILEQLSPKHKVIASFPKNPSLN
jgi:putative transcriptional regulator